MRIFLFFFFQAEDGIRDSTKEDGVAEANMCKLSQRKSRCRCRMRSDNRRLARDSHGIERGRAGALPRTRACQWLASPPATYLPNLRPPPTLSHLRNTLLP